MRPAVASALIKRLVAEAARRCAMPVSTAGSTPAPPAVGAATMTPIAAFTSCTASARASTSRKSVPASGPGGPARSFSASPPTSPDAERRSPTSPCSTAPRITTSARPSASRISATGRPWSFASASSATRESGTPRDSASRIASASALYMLRAHLVEAAHPAHPVEPLDRLDRAVARRRRRTRAP